jgi:CIC family chloride channel protein
MSKSFKRLEDRLQILITRLRVSETAVGLVLAVVVGLLAGLGAVVFRWMIRGFGWIFFNRGAALFDFLGDYYVIVLPALGGLVVGLLIYLLAREAKGEGPPEVMEALALGGGRIRRRVAGVKALASSICIGSGGSVGREGPIVQIGSSVGSTIGQWLRLPEDWVKTLLLCGAAGGISATFNAPIGGVLFALEVLERRFVGRHFGFIVISSVTADLIAHRLLGTDPSFLIPSYNMASNWEVPLYVVLGIVAALAAIVFVRFFYRCQDFFNINVRRVPAYIKPALGGLVVGAIGFFYPEAFGVGYGRSYGPGGVLLQSGAVDLALIGQLGLLTLIALLLLKMVATSVTLGSGGSGGVFAPSLFIGSMLGGVFGVTAHWLFPTVTGSEVEASGAYALVGMGAFFAAVVRGPMTAIILLFEMTRNYALILPLMTAVIISTFVARAFNRESIYTLGLIRRGVDIHRREEADIMSSITVGDIMTSDFPTVPLSMSISEVMDRLHDSGHHGFPVLDESGDFSGIVTLQDVEAALLKKDASLTVGDIANKSPIVAYPDQSVHDALARLGGRDVGRLPVVDRRNPKRLLGVLRRHDVTRAYAKAVAGHGRESTPAET